jgi:transcriptional regulator with XRE-family HTH domain
MDISKAIDKRGGVDITWFGSWLRSWRKDNGITQKEVASLFPSKSGALTGCVANWELGLNLPTAEQFSLICEHFNLPFESLEEAERKVIGTKQSTLGGTVAAGERNQEYVDLHKNKIVNITAPATPEAVKWQGWGTALKPAFEPVVVARKPFKGTVASNVLEWGVGGLNIDGSRIATDEIITNHSRSAEAAISKGKFGDSVAQETFQTNGQKLGRWPANIILDPYTAELLDEQSEEVSRFFYVAKASKRDRNEGLEELEGKEIGAKGNGLARTCATCNASVLDGCDCPDRTFVNPSRKNFHPTVKPTALMEYLIKLVTPEGGIVLDPFTGSGSTGKAALLNDYQFIGIELTEEYLPIIKGRLEWANKEKKDTIF